MSQRNGRRAQERRQGRTLDVSRGAPVPVAEALLATLSAEDLGGLKARQTAYAEAQQAMAEAELELRHFQMILGRKHGWGPTAVAVDLTTGEVRRWNENANRPTG